MTVRAVVALPDSDYYLWQMLVQAAHFEEVGLPVTYMVYSSDAAVGGSRRLVKLAAAGLPVQVVADPRGPAWDSPQMRYHPMMKPWTLAQYFRRSDVNPAEPVLYLDPDVMLAGGAPHPADDSAWPGVWHASDTDSYTGPGYIKGKGEGLWLRLCRMVGVDPDVAAAVPGGGAQYVIGGPRNTAQWWEDVAELSVDVYQMMEDTAEQFHPEGHDYPVQSWCAEMYVTWLAAIRDGFNPSVDPAMEFLWANGPASEWSERMFFHNAGVTDSDGGRHFCKVDHQISPWGKVLDVSPESASSPYVEQINRTAKRWPGLIW